MSNSFLFFLKKSHQSFFLQKNTKKDALNNLKRVRREAQKNDATLKAELAALQGSLQREEAREKRERQRATFLAENIRQVEFTNTELEEEIAALREENLQLQVAAEEAHIELETQK